ncbi:neuroblastoma-amplified sequence, partial [Tremellales sp. Uapishka_1]
RPPRAKDLYIFFAPLPFASLSRALDILDVHLESGEILARWETPVQLRFLLQSARDRKEQIELAEKMVRKQSAAGLGEAKWERLWGDMGRLSGGEDALLRGAFGMLGDEDMMGIYLGGVLRSGNFSIAGKMIKNLQATRGLSNDLLEKVVLATSREFYENAETGNIHTGEMKLAYDCLDACPPSARIIREKEFIESTSRLCSFRSLQGAFGQITPIEILHTKDKLTLIDKVINTSDDAFRHKGIILDLADKLGGYRADDLSQLHVLRMLLRRAIHFGDFALAVGLVDDMVGVYRRKKRTEKEKEEGMKAILWRSSDELGSHDDFDDLDTKMRLLGQAVEFAPAGEVAAVLARWRRLEDGRSRLDEAKKSRRVRGVVAPRKKQNVRVEEARVLGSRTAAKAAKLALDISGRAGAGLHGLRSGAGSRNASRDRGGDRSSGEFERVFQGFEEVNEAERVRIQAKKALARGVGWLLGAEEGEVN